MIRQDGKAVEDGHGNMRSCFHACTLAVFLLTCAAFGDVGRSVPIPNADLETGADSPDGWTCAHGEGGTGAWSWDTENVHSGKRAFRIRKDNAEGYSQLVSGFLAVEPGRDYEVSAWIKLHHRSAAGVYFMVSQYRADGDAMQLPNAFGDSNKRHSAGAWQRLRLVFTVREPNTRVRIHALVAFGPCDVTWDDFSLGPPAADAKPRYEPPVEETLPPLEPARQIVAARRRSAAQVEVREGRTRFVIDGKPAPPCFYVSPFWTPNKAQIADFKNAGVRVYLVPLVLGRNVYANRGPWLGPGKYDFTEVDELLWRVLRVDPEGYVMFYMACDPYRDWGAEHPDDVTQDQNGLKAIVHMHPKRWGGAPEGPERFGPSLVSEVLRGQTAETLKRLVAHVKQSEPGKAVIGYHVAGSNDGQWFHWTSLDPKDLHLADYSPGARRSFRNWLRRLYKDDVAAFRRAWNRPDLTFETVSVPSADRLWADKFLVDPATDQDIADYTRFYSEGVAETVLHLAKTLREASGGNILLGTYYEDITCNSANHIALARFLESDAMDFLAGPAAYGVRLPGQCGAIRSVFGSALLHGKIYLTEQDWRSWHSAPNKPNENESWGRAETSEAHNAMVRRECGMMLAYGMGTWWYDMSGGWFRDDQIMAAIAEARRAFDLDLATPGVPRADLAVFVSEESNHYVYPRAAAHMRYNAIIRQVYDLNTSGVPYRLYLPSDLGRLKLPEHRAYLFLNAHVLSDAQRKAIEDLRRDGKLLVFLHAPGIVPVGAIHELPLPGQAVAIERVTGIKVRPMPAGTPLGAVPVKSDSPLLAHTDGYLAPAMRLGWPAFEVTDEKATPLATYPGTQAVSVAHKQFPDHQVVLAGGLDLSDQFIHNLAKAAGAWCVADPGDAVYASERFATIHALHGGQKTLRLARPARVTDLTTGQLIADRATTLALDMRLGETRWFHLTPLP